MFAIRRSLRIASARSFTTLGKATLAKAVAASIPSFKPLHRNASTTALEKALKAEIKFEEKEENRELSEDYTQLKEDLLKIWTVADLSDNKSEVTLTRKYNSETITVTYDVQDISEEENYEDEAPEDDEEPRIGINFTVNVENDKGKVIISCLGNENDVQIQNVAYLKTGEEYKEHHYGGPDFSQLDSELQEQFFNYLDERGVNSELTSFIVGHAEEVENSLYLGWLKNVHSVVSAK